MEVTKLLVEQGISTCAIARHGIAYPVERMGINDEFGDSDPIGELLEQFELCAKRIAEIINKVAPDIR